MADERYDRYLKVKKWTAKDAHLAKQVAGASSDGANSAATPSAAGETSGYLCYQHRDVTEDTQYGRSTCRKPFTARRCPVRQPTFPTPAGTCLCCPMAGHRCPPCWGCLLPLSRRRAFAGKLYERETGGTANVFFASERFKRDVAARGGHGGAGPLSTGASASPASGGGGRREEGDSLEIREIIFKLRDGEVTEEEREATRLVEGVGLRCGLIRPSVALEWVAELQIGMCSAEAPLASSP